MKKLPREVKRFRVKWSWGGGCLFSVETKGRSGGKKAYCWEKERESKKKTDKA